MENSFFLTAQSPFSFRLLTPVYAVKMFFFTGIHIFGLCVTALITDILQLSTGQHTPYWLEVCKPNLTHINMSSCDEAFILEDICSGQDLGLITAGR